MLGSLRLRNPLASLSPRARATLLALALLYGGVILAVVLIGPSRIFAAIVELAQWLALQPYGRLLIVGVIVLCSFPPMVGYSNSITLCGLAFGSKAGRTAQHPDGRSVWEGWAIAVVGAMLGSALAFCVLRFVNHSFRRARWLREIKESRQWRAMHKAVRDRGFGMLVLIRCCPFPFVCECGAR